MSSQRHNECNVFANNYVNIMIGPGCNAFCVLSDKQVRAHLKNFKIKTHVQTTHESHYLNMDFRSFDNGFKQLSVTNFMQEYALSLKA